MKQSLALLTILIYFFGGDDPLNCLLARNEKRFKLRLMTLDFLISRSVLRTQAQWKYVDGRSVMELLFIGPYTVRLKKANPTLQ